MDPQTQPDILKATDGDSADHPAKLLRIATMVREMLAEVRRAPVDEEGRRRLRDIHQRSMAELREVLSADLADELDSMTIPLGDDIPTESELRITQAQLTGWLEGLFHGIQASFMAQQLQAQQKLGQLRQGALPPERRPGDTGQYL